MRTIQIFDSTLRDGEQIPGARLNAEQKVEVARQLARLGVNAIEAGFPSSSPGDLEAVQRVGREVRGPVIVALARCTEADIEEAWKAVEPAARRRIHVFLGMSDIHIESIIRKDRDTALRMACESVARAKEKVDDVEFSPMDATRMDFDYLCEVLEKVIEKGATVVNIPDTVGFAQPYEFGNLFRRLFEKVPKAREICLSAHCHDDLGLATATSLAAIHAGANQVECCVNGLGERAGNAATEEIAVALKVRGEHLGARSTIVLKEIVRTSRLVSSIMGIPVQPNKAIVGRNAFAHSSGVHQDGILKDKRTFEIISPEELGWEEHRFVLTARSGRNALGNRLGELGYELRKDEIDEVYKRFLEVADKKNEVTDEDLHAIMGDRLSRAPEVFRLVEVEALSTTSGLPHARVKLRVGEEEQSAESTGDGPIDALFRAIETLTSIPLKVVDYSVRSVSSGKEAMGEVTVHVQSGDVLVTGRASGTDIVEASARAYVAAANQVAASGEGRSVPR